MIECDSLIIGSGIAGLSLAIRLSKFQKKIILVSGSDISGSASNLAQGGIVGLLNPEDSAELHIADTLRAGSYHNNKEAVRLLSEQSIKAIQWLQKQGVEFDKDKQGGYDFALEGGHSIARVLHVGDHTGHSIIKALGKKVSHASNIDFLRQHYFFKLLVNQKTCYGALIFDLEEGKTKTIYSQNTILATGGLGQLFQYTTNPGASTGEAIAIAGEAGAKLADLEFIQFHPTAYKANIQPLFLLSESLRGEGALIIDNNGKRFMKNIKDRELAPRDIVAIKIYKQMLKGKEVFLDIRHKKRDFLKQRFPIIYKRLKKYGHDLHDDPIPITPAAHYLCGGIKTDLFGKTNIASLFAIGECACTGVHGANRLASNSLLEAVVFSSRLAQHLKKTFNKRNFKKNSIVNAMQWANDSRISVKLKNKQYHQKILSKIKKIMWQYVGVARSRHGLETALKEIEKLNSNQLKHANSCKAVDLHYLKSQYSLLMAKNIIAACLKRKKTLGCHYVEKD